MAKVFQKSKFLTDAVLHYCPGCGHGIVHRLVAEALDDIQAEGHVIGIAPVGCAVFAYNYFNCDMIEASHGRAPAVATAVKRVNPENIVFAYQGDGDLASIGLCETVHAAARGENVTIIFINNAIYGMTGGQMAPTTLIGQKTTTSPLGRDPQVNGNPIKICEMLATLDGSAYIERVSICDTPHILSAKKAIRKAFQNQVDKKGFSLVEVLCNCPTNWGMTPQQSMEYVKNDMTKIFPLGVFKEV